MEAIVAALADDPGENATKWAGQIASKAPTSLKVSFEQLRRAAVMTLAADLAMEFRLSQSFLADEDFFEGVRALLVDKDNAPNWRPATLATVTPERVESYFLPALAGELSFDPPLRRQDNTT